MIGKKKISGVEAFFNNQTKLIIFGTSLTIVTCYTNPIALFMISG